MGNIFLVHLASACFGSLREWLSDLNDQAHILQRKSQMLDMAINVLNSTNENSSTIKKRTSQLVKIKSALGHINMEIKVIETKCNQFGGPDCDGIVLVCDSKCKTCTSISPGQCTSCYGNFEGESCSVCKSGWNGLNCTTPICDAKCLNCSSPGQCSLCYGHFEGLNCSVCSGNFNGVTCSTCKSGWTGSDCNSIDKTGEIANSTILTNSTHLNRFMNEIMNGVSLQNASQPTLLFRASNHAFRASAFHTKCDNKGPTITIVKSASGAIFGGYTSKSWGSDANGIYVSDSSAFMFSLISPTGEERFTKLTQENGWSKKNGLGYSNSIHHNSSYGPTFGTGNDLRISDSANAGASSGANVCRNYCDSLMTYNTPTAQSYLEGSNTFKVSEYEVYTF